MIVILKKLLFVVAFVLLTLVLPAVILLMFFDAANNFSVYVIVYGVVIFGILGYVVSCVRNMEKKIEETMNDIKMQNAAIAYKITNVDNAANQNAVQQPEVAYSKAEAVNSNNIPLNPPDPLVMPAEKPVKKAVDDGFDDFK